jgi:gamma-glutamyltranspeptidase / glutathione hydrolase
MVRRSSSQAAPHVVRVTAAAVAAALVVAACSEPLTESPELPDEVREPEPSADPDPDPEPEPEPEPADEVDEQQTALGSYGVSAGDAAAVDAGMAVLEAGGSAVDAAIATAFAVSVVEPFASGIGGGGATLVADVDGEVMSYDYREVVNQEGTIPPSDTGIPGFVAGMGELHADHGVLDWDELLAPAIALAADGSPTSRIVADQLRTGSGRLDVGGLQAFFPNGTALSEGDLLVQPELAATLGAIAQEGPDVFYAGALGDLLAAEVDGIDASSLAVYEVQRTPPPRGRFAGHELVAAAPPLPGAALIQQLQVAEALGVGDVAPPEADHIHRMMMAWRVADRSVSASFGDPDFVEVPVARLTDPGANAEVAAGIPGDRLLAGARGGAAVLAGEAADTDPAVVGNTTHITVVDAEGTVVSMTNTLTNFWGSGQHVAGFFLNDQLSRFSIGGEANRPEPGRRSVSWSLPLLVLDDEGRPVLGIGSPGGRRILTIEASILVRWALHGQSLEDAVTAPRVHLEGDTLQFERLPDDPIASDLRGRGYALEVPAPVYYFGSVQALEIDHDAGTVTGAQDPRRAGTWRSERS